MSDAQLIAEYLARKGATVCAQGESNGVTPRAWIHLARAESVAVSENALIAARHVTLGSNGREYVRNGLGERVA